MNIKNMGALLVFLIIASGMFAQTDNDPGENSEEKVNEKPSQHIKMKEGSRRMPDGSIQAIPRVTYEKKSDDESDDGKGKGKDKDDKVKESDSKGEDVNGIKEDE